MLIHITMLWIQSLCQTSCLGQFTFQTNTTGMEACRHPFYLNAPTHSPISSSLVSYLHSQRGVDYCANPQMLSSLISCNAPST